MASLFQILTLLIGLAKMLIFAHFIMSWLTAFNILNLRQPLVAQIWHGLEQLLAPLYQPLRNMLPQIGGLDLAPLAALILLQIAQIILNNNIGLFH